ncbi:MAG: sigma factor-like helix-turn-helix DNA-binding protein [Pseudomonadota bacterium]
MSRRTEIMAARDTDLFEVMRPRFLGIGYRILGTLSEAEDAAQDTFIKWAGADREAIAHPQAWLITAYTRRCLDLRRAGHAARVEYVGTWLPEPIQVAVEETGQKVQLASTLSTALLLVLERLTPRERAAYLLHEIFELPYADLADTLALTEPNCRKLVSRARSRIAEGPPRSSPPPAEQERLLAAFRTAVTTGEVTQLVRLLAADVRLTADGGGKVPAIRETLEGIPAVTAFLADPLRAYWDEHRWDGVDLNAGRGLLIRKGSATAAAVTVAYDTTGKIASIFIVRNPDKLSNLGAVSLH